MEIPDVLRGKPVCMHTSLRSFGPGFDGNALIDAYLDAGCTLMVPTFSHDIFGIDLPPDHRYERNGIDYDDTSFSREPHDRVYSSERNDVGASMGTFPRLVLERAGRVRSAHPIASFTAIGPLAHALLEKEGPSNIYGGLAAIAKREGFIVLAGVDLDRMTLIHLAEKRAGRNLFRRAANGPDGKPVIVETGSCSDGFVKFEPALRPIRMEGRVGESRWQIFPAKSALNIAVHAIRREPRITHCGDTCVRCDHLAAGGVILP